MSDPELTRLLVTGFAAEAGLPVTIRSADLIRPDFGPDRQVASLLQAKSRSFAAHFGVVETVNPERLAEAGWGIIMPSTADDRLIEALQPLLDLRRSQAGALYREFSGSQGYRPDDSVPLFLARQGVSFGSVDPHRGVPYYLLLVGEANEIPYSFQQMLSLHYAVGRIAFPAPEDYALYAISVVAAERGAVALPRRAMVLNPPSQADPALQLLTDLKLPADWHLQSHTTTEQTRKTTLTHALADAPPALLVVASNGVAPTPNNPEQTGALVLSPEAGAQQAFFAAADLDDQAAVFGSVWLLLSPWSVGAEGSAHGTSPESERPYPSALAQRLLTHPRGGALAIIGHTAGFSLPFATQLEQQFLASAESTLTNLIETMINTLSAGKPVGMLQDHVSRYFARLGTTLFREHEDTEFGKQVDPNVMASLSYAYQALRSLIILGDPAVRLTLVQPGQQPQRGSRSEAEILRELLEDLKVKGLVAIEPESGLFQLPEFGLQGRGKSSRQPLLGKSRPATPSIKIDPPSPSRISDPELWFYPVDLFADAKEDEDPPSPADPVPPPADVTAAQETPVPPPDATEPASDAPRTDQGQGPLDFGTSIVHNHADTINYTSYHGLGPGFAELAEAVQQQLKSLLHSALETSELSDVRTYVAADPAVVELQEPEPAARLLSRTTVALTGETRIVTANELSEDERALLQLHQQTLQTVLGERTRLIEALARVATSLVGR